MRDSEMPAVMAATDLSLSLVANVPELWGNSANKFFDALASGTPIAINHRGWQADLIENHRVGLVLPNDDPAAAAELINEFTSDAARLKKSSVAARSLASANFDVNILTQKLNNVFANVVANF